MSKRAFRLASLLRLRRAQEDQAAAELARAAAARLHASDRADQQRSQLSSHRTPSASTPAGWTASVAARAALSAASRQAEVEADDATGAVDAATESWRAKRRETAALEHLEQRHRDLVAREQLKSEQLQIDEHTTATTNRHDEGNRP